MVEDIRSKLLLHGWRIGIFNGGCLGEERSMQLTPVRIEGSTKKAYRITILVGDDERPWREGWFARKLLQPDPGWEEGDIDLIPIPDWMVRANGWQLPPEQLPDETRRPTNPSGPKSGWEIARELSREMGIQVGFIPPR